MAFNVDELLTEDKKTIKEKKKMGRPTKAEKAEIPLTKRVVSYLSSEENEKFEMLAREEMLSNSAMLRRIILQYIKER